MATRRTSRSADPAGRRAGFTLVELLVVLTIAAGLAAMAIPLGRAALPGLSLRAAAEGVATEARLARAEAIRRGSDGWIEFDLAGRRYRRAGEAWKSVPAEFGFGVSVAESERAGPVGRIRFMPDGGSTGGRALLTHSEAGYAVAVDWLTGAVALAPAGSPQ